MKSRWTRSRFASAFTALFVVANALCACGEGNDAAAVTVSAPSNLVIREIAFDLTAGTHHSTIRFPDPHDAPLSFPKTVSLTFPSNVGPTLAIDARGFDGMTQTAAGTATVAIASGKVTQVALALSAYSAPSDGGLDGSSVDLEMPDMLSMDLVTSDLAIVDLIAFDLRPGN